MTTPVPRRLDDPATGGWASPTTWAPLAVLAVGYVLLMAVVEPAIHWSDTMRVYDYAAAWPHVPQDHHAMRLGLVVPTRAAQAVLGYGPGSYRLVAHAFGLTLVAGMYVTGRAMFGQFVGIVGTVVLLASPYVANTERFLTAGLVLPDLPAAAVFTLGVGLLVLGLQEERAERQRTLLLAAGAALGGAYLLREFVPAMYLVVPIAFLLWRVPLRRMGLVALTMLGALTFELVVHALVFGDPLARLNVAGAHGATLAEPQPFTTTLQLFAQAFTDDQRGQLLVLCAVVVAVGAALTRDRRLVLVVVWVLSLVLALLALGGLLDPEAPSLRIQLTRYWFPVFPPLVLGAVGTLAMAVQRLLDRRWWPAAVGVGGVAAWWFVVALLLPAAGDVAAGPHDVAWQELRGWLADEGATFDRIATDSRTDRQLDIYRHRLLGGGVLWDGEIVEFDHHLDAAPAELLATGPVLYAEPWGPEDPPPDARTLFRSTDGSLLVATTAP